MVVYCLFFASFLFLSACAENEGGSEFGNPSRPVMGTVVEDAGASLKKQTTGGCPADQVIATDSSAQTTLASIDETECSFDMELVVDRSYVISFVLGDEFVATLIVRKNSSSLRSNVVFIAQAALAMNLGNITIIDNEAFPENEPYSQNDQDEDGTDDFDDEDDDGDGILDDEEEDCDLDGFLDEDDEDDLDCDEDEGDEEDIAEFIVEVSPFNEEEFVDLDEEISVLFSCEVDEESVTEETFVVQSDDDALSCEFEFSDSGEVVTCEHDDQDFLPDTIYTATVDGVTCEDGTGIEADSWSWTSDEED